MASPFEVLSTQFTGTVDATTDAIPFWQANSSAAYWISRNSYLNLSSNPVGLTDTQTLTNKTLTTPTLSVLDADFTVENSSDNTKIAKFSAASLSTGTTRTYTLPDISDTVVTLTATQTLTNKTLTSPTINTPTISNATISADTITGYTTSNSGTIYGISVTTGTIGSAALATNAVTGSKLATSAIYLGYASITSSITTPSTNYVQATGLSVSAVVPSGGRSVKVTFYSSGLQISGTSYNAYAAIFNGTPGGNPGSVASNQLNYTAVSGGSTGTILPVTLMAFISAPAAGTYTYNVGFLANGGGTTTINANTGGPSFLLVELI